jgi:tRNA 2-thiouridine synthesizing protein B
MSLHVINKSSGQSSALQQCLALLQEKNTGSAILLIEDAVYSVVDCQDNAKLHEQIKSMGLHCYCLQEDIEMRGLHSKVADCFELTDYAGFVQLSLDYDKVQSWS